MHNEIYTDTKKQRHHRFQSIVVISGTRSRGYEIESLPNGRN
jgi:hypothetical protein